MPVNFLLWDHDGVLVDTERWYFEATKLVLGGIGVDLTQENYLDFMASGRSCWELALRAGFAEDLVQGFRGQRDSLYQEFLMTQPIEVAGVKDVLESLDGHYRMAIVTTARRADLEIIHADRDLLRHFEFVLTEEDCQRCKPAPDPYLAALARFEIRAGQALALEDSSRGLRSARAAGIECVVIRSPFTASQDFTGAVRVIDSVGRLPEVLTSWQR